MTSGEVFGTTDCGNGKLIADYPPLGGTLDFSTELRLTATGKYAVLTFAGTCDRIPPWRAFNSVESAIEYACACQNATRTRYPEE